MSTIEAWSRELRRRLSSNSVCLQTREGLRELTIEDRGNLWVVGRSKCVFRSFDVTNIPSSRTDQVVSAQIPLLSPFRDPGYWYCIQNDQAKIWIWDEVDRKRQALNEGIDLENFGALPEACLTAKRNDGTCLYQSIDGYFGHLWKSGQLVADTWWEQAPTEIEWRTFLRGAGLELDAVPGAEIIDYSKLSPWPDVRLNLLAPRSIESVLVKGIAAVFILMFGFQLTGSVRLGVESWLLQNEIAEMSETHEETIEFREEAFEARVRADQLVAMATVSQASLLDAVSKALPASSRELSKWQYQQNNLEFVVDDANPDLENYVRELETVEFLSGVSVEPLPQTKQIRISALVESQ